MQSIAPYMLCIMIFAVGLYAVAVKKNLIKIIVGVIVIENAVNLFLLLMGYREPASGEAMAPIMVPGEGELFVQRSVDPVPQALIVTSIVIGISVIALMVVMALRLHQKYGTFDMTEIRKLRG